MQAKTQQQHTHSLALSLSVAAAAAAVLPLQADGESGDRAHAQAHWQSAIFINTQTHIRIGADAVALHCLVNTHWASGSNFSLHLATRHHYLYISRKRAR